MIIIVDYGMGNVGSIKNMLKRIGYKSEISNDLNVIKSAEKIILPGVGAFDHGMNMLNSSGIAGVLKEIAKEGLVPILGICLGMQLLMEKSEEGIIEGLGLIKGRVKKFEYNEIKMKVPHMGWNLICPMYDHRIMKDFLDEPKFYFVHSYYVQCDNQSNVLAKTKYGIEFDSFVYKKNVFGTQFHPEKSHKYGMKLLKNFAEMI